MTQYIMTTDKNGKARYYKVADGKKKVISKAEYEANVVEITEAAETAEVVETTETTEVTETAETEEVNETAETTETTETTESADASVEDFPKTEGTDKSAEISNTAATAESEEIAKSALEIVKSIIAAADGCHSDKVRLQVKKNCTLINYRNCMVCSLTFGEDSKVTALKFMGATLETRKQASVYEYGDLNSYAEEIIKQVDFIDWWYLNPTKKAA